MKAEVRSRLEARGWRVGAAEELLGLRREESALVELRFRLAAAVRERRRRSGLTQARLAEQLGSSQSRVAKVEAADPSVAFDLLIRALLALGADLDDLAEHVATPVARRPRRRVASRESASG